MGRSYTNLFASNDESSKSFEIDWDVCSFETLQSNPIVELLVIESGRLCERYVCSYILHCLQYLLEWNRLLAVWINDTYI